MFCYLVNTYLSTYRAVTLHFLRLRAVFYTAIFLLLFSSAFLKFEFSKLVQTNQNFAQTFQTYQKLFKLFKTCSVTHLNSLVIKIDIYLSFLGTSNLQHNINWAFGATYQRVETLKFDTDTQPCARGHADMMFEIEIQIALQHQQFISIYPLLH